MSGSREVQIRGDLAPMRVQLAQMLRGVEALGRAFRASSRQQQLRDRRAGLAVLALLREATPPGASAGVPVHIDDLVDAAHDIAGGSWTGAVRWIRVVAGVRVEQIGHGAERGYRLP